MPPIDVAKLVEELCGAVQDDLLDCPDLHLDDIDPTTELAIARGRAALDAAGWQE